ncbi:hypothetical protein EOD39_13384 [Acipenser ruthenus]|uniref:Uncharacterized protein n=1 Tax=Acipenser ruthenus TaxID=7906 RepID=A0A444UIV8_ACIRT|nr:hypothetical protein EOD39_13384 [Acipenser ruthenus]
MAQNQKKRLSSQLASPSKGDKSCSQTDLITIVEACMERHRHYFESQFSCLEEIGRGSDALLSSIQSNMKDLKADLSSLRARVDKNTKLASLCSTRIDQLEAKLADIEDRNRRPNLACNYMAQCRKGLPLSTILKNICLKQQQMLRSSWIRWGLLVRSGPNVLLLPLPKGWNMKEEDSNSSSSMIGLLAPHVWIGAEINIAGFGLTRT